MPTVGQRIRNRRSELNLSAYELARVLDVTPQAVSLWELDRTVPRAVLLPALAAALQITVDDLLGEEVA